jgi:hypothetical protein
MAVIYGAPPFLNFYKRAGIRLTKIPVLHVPPSGAATTFAYSGSGTFIGLVQAPPPYMSNYAGVAPFDTTTEFMVPSVIPIDASDSPLTTNGYIKAIL